MMVWSACKVNGFFVWLCIITEVFLDATTPWGSDAKGRQFGWLCVAVESDVAGSRPSKEALGLIYGAVNEALTGLGYVNLLTV